MRCPHCLFYSAIARCPRCHTGIDTAGMEELARVTYLRDRLAD